ncbi:hypothetical protein [Pseudomonas phage Misse]|uniref:Uncharacterized protein n=1 Tax=Pseudomonas phage Bertil TaxID=2801385 RepID=A0A7T8ER06_9CAUD|nr:hypothetical protein [Pseudomonas phage Bertil]QQO90831.1 hypothetical protein [Pseudomonas phage Misse]QQO90882.1 hypothetical protein [Pseudomonas phage Strit]
MAKSSAAQALASLGYKFQAKIKEVGNLKHEVKRLTLALSAAGSHTGEQVTIAELHARIRQLNGRIVEQSDELVQKQLRLNVATKAYENGVVERNSLAQLYKDAKSSVGEWKSFSLIAAVLGVAVGSLGTLAYLQQVV